MDAFTDTIRNFGDGGFVWYFHMRAEYGYYGDYGYYSRYGALYVRNWIKEHCKRFGW